MDGDEEAINICTELWDDIEDFKDSCHLSFDAPFTSGFRFRYQSEIDKKSFSLLKSDKNATPMLNVTSTYENAIVQIELVTDKDKSPHFNMFYEVPKDKMNISSLQQGVFVVQLPNIGQQKIKLDSLGIRKMKNKEALPYIKQNYPHFTDSQAKQFFNQNKDIVRLKATLFQHELPACEIYSEIIKSQISKENKSVKIKHLAPKTVAEIGEELIVVLEKKITTEDFQAGIMFDKERVYILNSIDQDGQTFIFRLPKIDCPNPTDGRFFMRCGESEDQKPIKFLPVSPEQRKRKSNEPSNINYLPLKRSNQENIPQPLYPESGMRDRIETDGIQPIPMDLDDIQNLSNNVNNSRNDNDSCKDSGINSGDHSSDNGDEMNSSSDESDEDIETEGFRRNKNQRNDYLPDVINVQAKDRTADSRLDINISNAATKKILTEVARIGHDFAFGKNPDDLFERIEKQLPVVFTLQDDVGDTPLNNAILKGNVEHAFKILQIVRTNCPWAIDLVNTSGHSALILSPACDVPPELIEKLLSAGCKLDLWDDTGKSAIIYAIEYQNVKALEVLLKHAKHFDLKNVLKRHETSYYTPLQLAIMHGFKKGIEMLLNLKSLHGNNFLVNVNETGLMNEETALHIAVSHDSDLEIIEMLLNRPDIDINQKLSNKTTALHVANKMKFFKISSLLKKHNAIDLPNCSEADACESDELDDETDEMEYKYCDSNQNCFDIKPIVEMNNSESVEDNIGVIIDSLKKLTIKGEVKSKLIEILVSSDGPTLTISDIQKIVRPTFKALFTDSNSSENKNDIREKLDRFNCLPNSCGQLIDCLKVINRFDLINKIEKNWGRMV